jgi:hypothetical protein
VLAGTFVDVPMAHIGIGEKRLAPIGVDSEEIGAIRRMGATVIRHDGINTANDAGTRPILAYPLALPKGGLYSLH